MRTLFFPLLLLLASGCAGVAVKTAAPPVGENPPPGIDAVLWKTVDALVAKLGDDNYHAREATQKEIEALPASALEALKASVERRSKDAEIKRRGEKAVATLVDKAAWNNLPKEMTNSIGMKLVLIPAGEFLMGSPETEKDRSADEGPQHKVRISMLFYMGSTAVTQAQWKAVMGTNPSHFHGDDQPVEHVSWNDCQEFLKKLSAKEGKTYRLPTEAEWEYACRAGTTTPFNTGETINTDQANFDGNHTYGNGAKGECRQKTTTVGKFKPNAWGLYNMHGNVFELCEDWHGHYPNSDQVAPVGPIQGFERVIRGGAWNLPPQYCRSARRWGVNPDYRLDYIGFRLVVTGSMTPP